jgi:hypothetical protein
MNFSQGFAENIILLLLAALVTGFGIPYVLKRIEERKLLQQKKFEADLARQSKIVEAQSKLLEDITQVLWKWRYLAKKVVYYASGKNKKLYQTAKTEYNEKVWDVLDEFRVVISRSRRLVSERAYEDLCLLYKYVVHDLDRKVSDIIEMDVPNINEALELGSRFSKEVSQKLDDEIDSIADEMELKVYSKHPDPLSATHRGLRKRIGDEKYK